MAAIGQFDGLCAPRVTTYLLPSFPPHSLVVHSPPYGGGTVTTM
jgi:hypothetical protein